MHPKGGRYVENFTLVDPHTYVAHHPTQREEEWQEDPEGHGPLLAARDEDAV